MSNLSRRESRRKYSWWWDSHISPKNSRWLKENLTGMDSKVKQMIKLIEEDADSFARRAEMYYKRRPELLRLVEDFYRAYRALAERYDHATGVIRHAHKTMVEVFPDQVGSMMMDGEADDNGPFMPPSVREFFEPDDQLHKDASGVPLLDLPPAKPEFLKCRRGLKQLDFFEKGSAREGLYFNETEEKDWNTHNENKHESDLLALKEALAKLEAEKEDGLLQYQKSLERLSNLEKEIMLAQEDSKKLSERASQAEAEVELLKGALIELKAEKELVLLHYQQCLEKISVLENHIIHCEGVAKGTSDRGRSAENEAQLLKQELDELRAEKECISAQHQQCTETISVIETKLRQAEENARRSIERAEMAESKVDNLNLAITELAEENEAYAVQCQQYLERISTLEFQILFAQDENKRLNEEISNGKAKLKNAEEHCLSVEFSHQSLQSELESLIGKMESRNVELTEKQIELGRLWTCVQEERLRFVEAETAFQTLQHLHNESQEELTSVSSELHNRAQMISDLEVQNQHLQEEMLKIMEDNKMLHEINLSSEASIRNMQKEISNLRATISKLEEEIERRVNERNTLLQEIYSLGEEFSELKQKHGAVLEQMESLELDPLSFGSSVKELHDNISKLSDACQMEKCEKSALLEKLDNMSKLLEKNALLENSIAILNSELKQVKEKVKTLEDTCQILEIEKAAAVSERNVMDSQVQILSENIAALLKKNVSLENALADADSELELLKEKSRIFEESLLMVGIEKTKLLNENESLYSQLKSTTQDMVEVETKNKELEAGNSNMEAEKKLLVSSIDELRNLLDSTKRENFNSIKFYRTRLASLECQLHLLRKEAQLTEKYYSEEADKSLSAEIEISVLCECLRELHSNNSSIGLECLKVREASSKSEKLIAYLEQKNADQQVELEALTDVLEIIRMGFLQIKKTIGNVVTVSPACKYENKVVSHLQPQFNQILEALEDIKKAFVITVDENHQLVLEKSVLITLLGQLQLDTADLDLEKCILSQNLKTNTQRLLTLLSEAHVLLETNEGLKGTVKEGTLREKTLRNNIQELKESYEILQQNNCMVMEEKKSLEIKVLDLRDAKFALEEEIHDIFLVLKHFISEKSLEVKDLNERMNQLRCIKDTLEELIRKLEQKLEDVQTDKSCLMRMIKGSENELKIARINSNQGNVGIANEKELMRLKELELSEANSKLEALQNEQTTLHRIIEDLKAIKEKQAKQIRKLSENNLVKSEENEELLGSKHCLETALSELRKKHKNAKTRELNLKSELQRWRNKEILWEAEYFELFSSLQIAAVHETCYLEKFRDFRKFFECMMMSKSNSTYADAEAQFLNERIVNLETENDGLKAHFSDYESAVNSLSGSVASLERQTIFHEKLSKVDGAKDVGSVGLDHEQVQEEESNGKVGSGFSELKNFQNRFEAVELPVDDIKRLASDRSLGSSVRAQASSNTPTDESESSRIWRLERAVVGQRKTYNSEASSEIMELPKDIMLDQLSACSSYGLSRREITPADDHMLELWGSTSKDSSMDYSEIRAHRFVRHRKDISITGIVSEKEMAIVDKLEISGSPKHPQQKRKNVKILERLLFDAQKLSNIQKQVQDLKTKVELAEQSGKSTGVLEYDTVKEQLEEAEEAIDKLFGVNHRLTQTVEYDSSSPKSISGNSSDEGVILRKRRVLEQIRRASEKISHLNFMVQKLQFLILNLEGEKQEMIKSRIVPRSPRVRLRDYLYSGGRPVFAHKQKRKQFCACIRTPTKGDIST